MHSFLFFCTFILVVVIFFFFFFHLSPWIVVDIDVPADHPPMPSADDAIAFIKALQEHAYVIGSGPYFWRTGDRDALPG